jgi:CHAT domain-containing protein/tetratricopeptide (TPR) repeat protein
LRRPPPLAFLALLLGLVGWRAVALAATPGDDCLSSLLNTLDSRDADGAARLWANPACEAALATYPPTAPGCEGDLYRTPECATRYLLGKASVGTRMATGAERNPPRLDERLPQLLDWLSPSGELDCDHLTSLADMGRQMGLGRDTIRLLDSAPQCDRPGVTSWIRGDAAYEAGEYSTALVELEAAVLHGDGVPGRAEVRLALVRKRTGDLDGATVLLEEIVQGADPEEPLRARALALLGYLQAESGASDQGLETLTLAIEVARGTRCPRAEVEARVNRAMVLEARGDGTAALADLRSARSLARSEGLIKWRATVEGAACRFWSRRGAWRHAQEHADLSLDLFRLTENPKGIVRTADAVVRGHLRAGTVPDAQDRERLALAEETLSRLDYDKGEVLLTALRGQLAAAAGDPPLGRDLLAAALDAGAAHGLEDERAGWTADFCELAQSTDRCDLALERTAALGEFEDVDVVSGIRLQRCIARCAAPDQRVEMVQQLDWVGRLELAIDTNETDHAAQPLEVTTGSAARVIYADAVRTALGGVGADPGALAMAFSLADLAGDRLSRASAPPEKGPAGTMATPRQVALDALSGRGVDEVAAQLRRGEAFVLIHEDDTGWVVFRIAGDGNGAHVQVIKIPAAQATRDKLVAATQRHCDQCARQSGSNRVQLDRCLSGRPELPSAAITLADALRGANRRTLIVATSPALEAVPLEVLPLAGGEVLADRANLLYVPSARAFVLSRSGDSDSSPTTGHPLLLADPDPCPPGTSVAHCPLPLGRLAETRGTADRLNQILRGDQPVLTGSAATEAAFLDALGKSSDLVFVGAHGLVPADGVAGLREPALILAPSREDDGLLTRREIASTTTHAHMVVLAACNGAGAHRGAGEVSPEYLGVAGGFLEAGALQVLVSHWSVDEEATSFLTGDFVRRLNRGAEPSRALALARRALRRDPEYADPYYWGAFTLLGAP